MQLWGTREGRASGSGRAGSCTSDGALDLEPDDVGAIQISPGEAHHLVAHGAEPIFTALLVGQVTLRLPRRPACRPRSGIPKS